MKAKLYLLIAFFGFATFSFSQDIKIDTSNAITKNSTKLFLDKSKTETDSLLSLRNSEILELKLKINAIDDELRTNLRSKKELQILRERIFTLERIRAKEEDVKKNIFVDNYNSAFVNLLSMEEDIKPLKLFNSSKNFYSSLKDLSNPARYKDYQEWFAQYKAFLKKRKSKDVMVNMASEIIEENGVLTAKTINLGPLSNVVLQSVEKFISSIGSSKRDLKQKSVDMFKLLTILDSFEKDALIIESKSQELFAELEALERLYSSTKNEFINTIGLDTDEMDNAYFLTTNETEKVDYLNKVKGIIIQGAIDNKFNRDESIHQMNTVQSLKIRFGDLTANLKDNIIKYKKLFDKYKNNEQLDLSKLTADFSAMLTLFDENFPSEKYKAQAIKMYRTE